MKLQEKKLSKSKKVNLGEKVKTKFKVKQGGKCAIKQNK